MLIHVRPIAISVAVISFFGLSFVGLFNGLTPLTCCKRAFIGAALVYLATALAVNIVNAILTSAIIDRHTNRQKETERVG
jgi:hypothetical protein